MAEVFRQLVQDLVKETTTSAGTANTSTTINLSGAADGRFQTFATALGTSATNSVTNVPVTITEGTTAQQTGLATFTHGTPSTILFTSIDKGSPGITFTTAATLSITSLARHLNRVSLRQEAITISTANYTSAIPNTHYRITISSLDAARPFQLPVTGVKAGDIVSGKIITNAPATAAYVLSIKTDAAGSTVDGVDVGTTASTKWVYFIQNEHFAFRCVTAGGAGLMAWESMVDGRIPCTGMMRLTTAAASEAGSAWTPPTTKSGVWDATPEINVGNMLSPSNGRIVVRRASNLLINGLGRASNDPNLDFWDWGFTKNTNTPISGVDGTMAVRTVTTSASDTWNGISYLASSTIGDYHEFQYRSGGSGGYGCGALFTFIGFTEML